MSKSRREIRKSKQNLEGAIKSGKRGLEEDGGNQERWKKIIREGFKVIFKFKEGQDIGSISPIALTVWVKKPVGEVEI